MKQARQRKAREKKRGKSSGENNGHRSATYPVRLLGKVQRGRLVGSLDGRRKDNAVRLRHGGLAGGRHGGEDHAGDGEEEARRGVIGARFRASDARRAARRRRRRRRRRGERGERRRGGTEESERGKRRDSQRGPPPAAPPGEACRRQRPTVCYLEGEGKKWRVAALLRAAVPTPLGVLWRALETGCLLPVLPGSCRSKMTCPRRLWPPNAPPAAADLALACAMYTCTRGLAVGTVASCASRAARPAGRSAPKRAGTPAESMRMSFASRRIAARSRARPSPCACVQPRSVASSSVSARSTPRTAKGARPAAGHRAHWHDFGARATHRTAERSARLPWGRTGRARPRSGGKHARRRRPAAGGRQEKRGKIDARKVCARAGAPCYAAHTLLAAVVAGQPPSCCPSPDNRLGHQVASFPKTRLTFFLPPW